MATYRPKSIRKPRGRGHERRDEILSAALALIERKGSDVSLREIAAAAGLSQASLFKHFATRSELLAALRDSIHTSLDQHIESAAQDQADVRGELDAILRAHARLAREQPVIFSLAFPASEAIASGGAKAPAAARFTALPGMARLQRAMAAAGGPAQAEFAPLASWFCIYGMALSLSVDLNADRLRGDETIAAFLDLLVRQFTAQG